MKLGPPYWLVETSNWLFKKFTAAIETFSEEGDSIKLCGCLTSLEEIFLCLLLDPQFQVL